MDELISYNVVIIPPEKVRKHAIEVSRSLHKVVATDFILNNSIYLPHITLYLAQYPRRNTLKILEILKKLSHTIFPFEIRLNRISEMYGGFVFWECEKDDTLQMLHEKIVHALNPQREGVIRPELLNLCTTSSDREDLKKYGSLLVGPNYLPHITITHLCSPSDIPAVLKHTQTRQINFTVTRIQIGHLGPYGTVSGIFREFPLEITV